MCGIAGIVGRSSAEAMPDVVRMLGCMSYRGPDDRGTWGERTIALGHLRLSIIDRSDAGHQPMFSADDRFVLSFNGEIYNYIELREELRRLGSTFRSASDSEVIVEAYRHWGSKCVERFNGMWAFAIYDRWQQVCFLSRDRFGVKPLFYTWDGKVLRFASEMKGLLHQGKGEPHWQFLYHFFDRRTPLGSDETVFRGILHLRPAHNLTLDRGTLLLQRYWEPCPARARGLYDYNRSVATFRALMEDAIRLRLRSDVPVGVCLSGGVDSSVIAMALAAQGVRPQTFSSIYREDAYSEEVYIDAVNEASQAFSHRITPRAEDFFPVLEQIVLHHDEPVRMPGVYSHWHVMQCARGHVTVLLDGQGADEIVGGYHDYYPSYLASLIRDALLLRKPLDALAQFHECAKGIRQYLGGSSPYVYEALSRVIPASVRKILGAQREKEKLFSKAFREKYGHTLPDHQEEKLFLRRFPSLLDREMYRTFVETNLPMLLRYEDRNSMAFSLEARVPFLDYRVVEFCHGLSYREKIRGYSTKWILREAFRDLLPPMIFSRKDKKGFPTPTAEWFRGPLRHAVEKRIAGGAYFDAGLFDRPIVLALLREHMEGEANHERTLFRLLSLDMWLRQRDIRGRL